MRTTAAEVETSGVCSLSVLEPIFEADLPSELYPARPVSTTGHQRKSLQLAVEKIRALTDRSATWQETTTLVGKVNRTLRGWANYFSVGAFSKAYRALDALRGGAAAPNGCASNTKSGGAGAIHSRTSTGTSGSYWARRAVDEGVRSCPRAGCRKSACPVR
jgi:hypothetical protein